MYTPIISNVRRSPIDDRDIQYTVKPTNLDAVDLRPYANEVEFQDTIGSCTGSAVVSACEILLQQQNKFIDLSRLFVYYNARLLAGGLIYDGAHLRDALKVSNSFGICPEDVWPYDITMVNVRPSDEAYAQALSRRLMRYESIDDTNDQTKIDGLRSALAEGYPVVISMVMTSEFSDLSGPLDDQRYQGLGYSPFTGLHAANVVGFNDKKQYFIVENSWGSEWGDSGYFALSYPLLRDVIELWAIVEFTSP